MKNRGIISAFLILALGVMIQPCIAKTEKKSRPWDNPKLSLREQVDLYRKINVKEIKTVVKNEKYEVEIIESINHSLWNSGPVQATVWDSHSGLKYTTTLEGTKLNKAEVLGKYLYVSMSFLGSSYPSDCLQVFDLHSWKSVSVIQDMENYEFSPNGEWVVYLPYQGKWAETLGDEVNLAYLGKQVFSVANLTGQEHLNYNEAGNRDDNGELLPVKWPHVKDRSRTWNLQSNLLWDRGSRYVCFIAGEKGLPNKEGEMQFTSFVFVKAEIPQMNDDGPGPSYLERQSIKFSLVKLSKQIESNSEIKWGDGSEVLMKRKVGPSSVLLKTEKWDATWIVPMEKLIRREE